MSSFFPYLAPFTAISTTTIVAVSIIVIASASLWLLKTDPLDPREPPLAHSRIPLIGHMINLLWHQNAYFAILQKSNPNPITTLKILSQRIYIITSPPLAALAFRSSQTIDFEQIKAHASIKAVNFGPHAANVINAPPSPDLEGGCYMQQLHHAMYGALSQGEGLRGMNHGVLGKLAEELNEIDGKGRKVEMMDWLKGLYGKASAEMLYGVENPVKWDESIISGIWEFESDLGLLVLDFYPALTARKGHRARLHVTKAFEKYYDLGLSKHASVLVRNREKCARNWGLDTHEISQGEISILFAAVTNTVPNVLSMLCYIFSSPSLVSSLRVEISNIVTHTKGKAILDISDLAVKCPLLTACWNETLRLTKLGASVRTILEDTMLDETYLLKKGAIVQIPTGVLQASPSTWGPDASEFNPQRWLSSPSKEEKKLRGQAYVPFGGGKNLCPGRHLAFVEVTAFVGMVVMGFDVQTGEGGTVKVPVMGNLPLGGIASLSPKGKVDVLITRRDEFDGVGFGFEVGGGGEAESLVG